MRKLLFVLSLAACQPHDNVIHCHGVVTCGSQTVVSNTETCGDAEDRQALTREWVGWCDVVDIVDDGCVRNCDAVCESSWDGCHAVDAGMWGVLP